MNRKNRGYLYLALFIGFLVLFYEMRKMRVIDIVTELRHLQLGWLVVAVLCMLLHWAIEGKIIQGLLARQYPNFSFSHAVRIPLIEHLFNAITPFSTGGQPAQLVALTKAGVDAGVAGSVCLMKFVVYQIMIVLNFIVCLWAGFRQLSGEVEHLSYLVALGFVINVTVVIALLMVMYCYPLTNWLVNHVMNLVSKIIRGSRGQEIRRTVLTKMDNFYAESQYMRKEKKMLLRTFALTMLQLICYYVVPYFVLLSLGVKQINVFQIIIFHAFIILIISLFPVPSGSGGAEYSFTLLFGTFVVSQQKLILALVLWRLITQFLGVFLGIIATFAKPDGAKKKAGVERQMLNNQVEN